MANARAVNAAMRAPRAAKEQMRQLWVQVVQNELRDDPGEIPLYLTLPGEDGLDLEALIAAGVLKLAENGAISESSSKLVVAVESSPNAELAIRRKFPGLQVINSPVQALLSGPGPTRYPTGTHLRAVKAKVVNLDFNMSLEARNDGEKLELALLALLKKFAQVHADPNPTGWYLLLTLNSTINWDPSVSALVARYLQTNVDSSPEYSAHLRNLMGDELFKQIHEAETVDFASWAPQEQQKLLLALVPKRIAFETYHHGWVVRTHYAARYGGETGSAPMASWILEFVPDERAAFSKDQLYAESVDGCIRTTHVIDRDGNLEVIDHA